MKQFLIAVAGSLCLLCSCESETGQQTVTGNGVVETEIRKSESFSQVETSGDVTVHYLKGTTPSVKVSCDGNLLEYVETSVSDKVMSVKPKSGIVLNSKNVIRVTVTSPSLTSVDLLGSGIVSADAMTGENVDVTINGTGQLTVGNVSTTNLNLTVYGNANVAMGGVFNNITTSINGNGNVELSGTNTKHILTIAGAGKANCYDLKTSNAEIVLTGAAKTEVSVSKSLSVDAAKGGTVYYKGNPSITQNLHDSGQLVDAN